MTATTPQKCINKAIEKAEALKPFTSRVSVYTFKVDSATNNEPYTVTLAHGGALEGAKCNCKGGTHPACFHRAAAYLDFIKWLGTTQGQDWFLTDYVCTECGLLPRLENSEVCERCATVEVEDISRLLFG